jgi:hypothetical protein
MARYCCVECQKADWSRHKSFCKLMVSRGVTARWFDPTAPDDPRIEEFAAHKNDSGHFVGRCVICERDEVRCVRAPCCGAPVCDNEADYALMSYSRGYCG